MSSRINAPRGTISVEYFPPKGLSAERALITGAHALRRFSLDFQTVTFGAGGAGATNSLGWASQLQALNNIPTACHVALCHFDQASLYAFAEKLVDENISRIILIRGDASDGQGAGLAGFSSVADAVTVLKKRYGFDVSVAAYPEIHPRAVSIAGDLDVLRAKNDAGASRAITQYFFDNGTYFRFRDRCAEEGIHLDLVPGVMPIANFEAIKRFSAKCKAMVPSRIASLFEAAGDDGAKQTDVARMIIEEQVRNLAQNGVDAIHIYTLNRVDLAADAIRAFRGEFSEDESTFRPALAG